MSPHTSECVRTALDAVEAIERFVQELTTDPSVDKRLVRSAVAWNFCVVGREMSRLLKRDDPVGQTITDAAGWVRFRDDLITRYDTVDHERTLAVARERVPVLRQELERLLTN